MLSGFLEFIISVRLFFNSVGSTGTSAADQIVVVITNDDEPEVDETFEVQLVSVAETGQKIHPEQVTITSIATHTSEDYFSQ